MLYYFFLIWAILGTLYQILLIAEIHGLIVRYGRIGGISLEVYALVPGAIAGQVLFIWVS